MQTAVVDTISVLEIEIASRSHVSRACHYMQTMYRVFSFCLLRAVKLPFRLVFRNRCKRSCALRTWFRRITRYDV
jgi:hypothetical protein